MQILVDADALPNVIKDILFRVADRLSIPLFMVANQLLAVPDSEYIKSISVPSGSDVADKKIVEMTEPGDLIITADIPLAQHVIALKAYAINPRGELYTEANIGERLAVRDLLSGLRDTGEITGGPQAFNHKDKQAFANQLDRFLTRYVQGRGMQEI